MNPNHHPRHGVLLQPQLPHEEAVRYVLRAEDQLHLAVRRDGHDRYDKVVLPGRIARVEPQRVATRSVHKVRVEPAEPPIGARITEVPGELLTGHFDLEAPGEAPRKCTSAQARSA